MGEKNKRETEQPVEAEIIWELNQQEQDQLETWGEMEKGFKEECAGMDTEKLWKKFYSTSDDLRKSRMEVLFKQREEELIRVELNKRGEETRKEI